MNAIVVYCQFAQDSIRGGRVGWGSILKGGSFIKFERRSSHLIAHTDMKNIMHFIWQILAFLAFCFCLFENI